jgi:hypothetical protein
MSNIKVNDQYPFEFETIQVDEWGQAGCLTEVCESQRRRENRAKR